MLCIDEKPEVADILQPETIDQMVRNDSGFSPIGWRFVYQKAWIRTGTLAGTSAVAVRDSAGYCWAFVTNTSSWRGAVFPQIIYEFIDNIVSTEGENWNESYDLFAFRDLMY
jgi:hypothetical protein